MRLKNPDLIMTMIIAMLNVVSVLLPIRNPVIGTILALPLVFLVTYVGYQPGEITVNQASHITINIHESNSQLNDVVVVGYGTQKRSDLTGAVVVRGGVVYEQAARAHRGRRARARGCGACPQGTDRRERSLAEVSSI